MQQKVAMQAPGGEKQPDAPQDGGANNLASLAAAMAASGATAPVPPSNAATAALGGLGGNMQIQAFLMQYMQGPLQGAMQHAAMQQHFLALQGLAAMPIPVTKSQLPPSSKPSDQSSATPAGAQQAASGGTVDVGDSSAGGDESHVGKDSAASGMEEGKQAGPSMAKAPTPPVAATLTAMAAGAGGRGGLAGGEGSIVCVGSRSLEISRRLRVSCMWGLGFRVQGSGFRV